MTECERKFSLLSHYARSLLTISRDRCKRFESCLKPSLRLQVVGFWHDNFSELISQALELERIESEGAPEKGKIEKGNSEKSVGQSSSVVRGRILRDKVVEIW